MKKGYITALLICLLFLAGCGNGTAGNANENNAEQTDDLPIYVPGITFSHEKDIEGITPSGQDHVSGTIVKVAVSAEALQKKSQSVALAYYYNVKDGNERLVWVLMPSPEQKCAVMAVFKTSFNGIGGLVKALGEGSFRAEFICSRTIWLEEAMYCAEAAYLGSGNFKQYKDEEIVLPEKRQDNPNELQYYLIYIKSETQQDPTEKELQFKMSDGLVFTVKGNNAKEESEALMNCREVFGLRYKHYGIADIDQLFD